MRRIAGCAVLLVALALGGTGARANDAFPWLVADDQTPGWVGLFLFDYPGTQVRFMERVDGRLVSLGTGVIPPDSGDFVRLPRATPWRCGRPLRRFVARARRTDGTVVMRSYSLRAPSCADRLAVDVPGWSPRGAVVPIGVRDQWRLGGIRPELCVRTPGARRRCAKVRLRGARTATRRIRVGRSGRWTVDVRFGGAVVRRVVYSGGRRRVDAGIPTLLVTGDSTPQGVDAALAPRLRGRAYVVRAWRGGSSLSHDEEWHWSTVAPRQAKRYAPKVTLISMGANEGWPMPALDGSGQAQCCGAQWQAAWRARAERMIDAYARGGAGHVLWMSLPTPEDPARRRITDTINSVVTAIAGSRSDVTLVHVERVLSPDGRFRRTLRYRGRVRVVRQHDGIHLTPAGASIAADVVMQTLAADPRLLARR